MKQFVIIFITLLIGFSIGRFGPSKETVKSKEEFSPELQNKIQMIGEQELRNYAMAEDAKAKLQAADELYGKVVLLFLADLNLHLDIPQVPKVTVWELPEIAPTPEPEPSLEPGADPNPIAGWKTMSKEFRENLMKGESNPDRKQEEKKTPVQKTIESYKLSNFVQKFSPQIKKLMGEFQGILKFSTGKYKGQTHGVMMSFYYTNKEKSLDGSAQVELTDTKGIVYSSSRGNGSNKNIKQSKDNPNLIFIECSPDSFFTLNMKTFPNLRGQFFEADEYRGTVVLQKN